MEHHTDFAGNYTFLFGENPSDQSKCYHCVRVFVRTVNIIEKLESKLTLLYFNRPRIFFCLAFLACNKN